MRTGSPLVVGLLLLGAAPPACGPRRSDATRGFPAEAGAAAGTGGGAAGGTAGAPTGGASGSASDAAGAPIDAPVDLTALGPSTAPPRLALGPGAQGRLYG